MKYGHEAIGSGFYLRLLAWVALGVSVASVPLTAQGLNSSCVVSVLNRNTSVNSDGTWVVPNIPANFGPVRARATCVQNGVSTFGQSALFVIPVNGAVNVPSIVLGSTTPIPASLTVTATTTILTQAGAGTQLSATATYAVGTTANVTAAASGTQYNVSNPAIATVNANGLVTAVSSGTALIQAVNEGTQGIITMQVVLGGVSHGGIPDSWAIANGLDPTDPAMPFEDPDHDGLTNLQEFQLGTDPNNPDTDGDGLTDGQEVLVYHTNPLLASTDGTGITDGIEVQTGTLAASFSAKLAAAMGSLEVKPGTFILAVNSIEGQASQQLTVLGHLIDGKTLIDLTSTQRGTNYSSSNLTICNFGSPDGNVFAGSNGSCTITVTNSGFTAMAAVTVIGFTPKSLSFISIPGFANGVAANGNYAYVAAGSAGLQVVNVSDRSNPQIVASLALSGNANAIRLLGNLAYVAVGSAGLQVVDVTNPLLPVILGTLATGGNALGLVVSGNTAYIANGSNLFIASVANPAAMTQIGALALAGQIQGVDVDSQRNLAIVAAGSSGIYAVDVSNPAALIMRGSASTGDARDVIIGGKFAFVADYLNSTTSVDITTPSTPMVRSHISDPNLGGFLQGIVLNGNFALAADVKFVNGIPITDVSDPTQLQARAILKFPQRDDNGMGIAADGSYVYLVTEHSTLNKFGSSGDSRLYIGQYRALQDLKGVPPTVSITSPVGGSTVIQGMTLPITVNAADDVAVASVNFLVSGQVVFTATSAPYQFNFKVPAGISSLTIGAAAVDFGGNIGTAQNVLVQAIPDPGTTVVGTTIDSSSNPVVGATVTCLGVTGASGTLGAFSIPGVPTVQGYIQCRATAINGAGLPISGFSNASAPVAGGLTNVGTLTLAPGATVLILTDADGPGPNALAAALIAANNTVTLRPAPEYSWDSTNPSLSNFNCVIHLDGSTYGTPLQVQAQTALENFVQSGKGFIASQWDGYERTIGQQVNMPDLVLQLWNTPNSQNCGGCSITYNVVLGQQNHPVLAGLPGSFTFFADGHDAGTALVYATQPSTVLMTVPAGGPGVLVRTFGSGRVVNFSAAPGYSGQQTLLDPNVQKLYVNAVGWACQGR
jgi:hypothetical protein